MKKPIIAFLFVFLIGFLILLGPLILKSNTLTSNLSLNKPALGESGWGPLLNSNADILDALFGTTTGHDHTGSAGEGPKIALTTSITGTLPVANGGTNGTTAAAARSSLSAAVSGANSDITGLSGLTSLNLPTAASPSQTTDGQIVWDSDDDLATFGNGSGTTVFGYYQTIQEEGISLTQRKMLNFIGGTVTCADNSGSTRTDCTINPTITIQESDGTPSVSNVSTIKVTNNRLTNNGSGTVTMDFVDPQQLTAFVMGDTSLAVDGTYMFFGQSIRMAVGQLMSATNKGVPFPAGTISNLGVSFGSIATAATTTTITIHKNDSTPILTCNGGSTQVAFSCTDASSATLVAGDRIHIAITQGTARSLNTSQSIVITAQWKPS